MVLILAMVIFPLIYSLWLSTHDWSPITRLDPPFDGLGNFAEALGDPRFWHGLQVTVVLLIAGLVLQTTIALVIAVILARDDIVGRNIFRALAFLPALINPIATGYIFRLLFHPSGGAVNTILSFITGRSITIDWVGSPTPALFAILAADTWQWTPFLTVVFLAALLGLPREPYEAARIDRASGWQVFRQVTFPGIAGILVIMLLIRGIEIIKLFDIIYAMTGGGPGTATETLAFYAYQVGFNAFRLGYAAAISWILLILLIVVSTLLLRTAGRRLLS